MSANKNFRKLFVETCIIPEFIINILIKTGFDNNISIELINEESIKEIEDFVTENCLDLLKDTVYSNEIRLKFLPGHRLLLMNLKSNFKEKKRSVATVQNSNVDILSDERKEELKRSLIDKLKNYCKKINLIDNITNESIVGVLNTSVNSAGKFVHKHQSKCPFCAEKIFPCTYNKHWQVSNFEKHLKSHLDIHSVPSSSVTNTNEDCNLTLNGIVTEELDKICEIQRNINIDSVQKELESSLEIKD